MRRLFLSAAIVLSFANPALAEEEFGRRGWYVGVGAGAAWDFLDSAVQDATGGFIATDATGTFNLRGGYRLFSWLAFEGMYEGAYGFTTKLTEDLGAIPAGKIASLTTHSLLGNVKFIIPVWRIHPYLVVGVGAQQHATTFVGFFDTLERSRWDFVVRPGVGLDTYVTKNWIINLELAPSISVRSYNTIPSETTDNVSLTLSGGIQYRF